MQRFLTGAVAALLAEVFVGLIVIASGAAPVNADRPPSALETRLFGMALRAAVARNAASESEPPPPSEDDLTAGAEIYTEMCARCHGDSAGGANTLGASFYPPAPRLTGKPSTYGERELFWIIKHGIRNTAMPAWGSLLSDEDIHNVAAAVTRFDGPPTSTPRPDSADTP
jgi:mono/diheme cytochrome c family protein